MFPPTRPSAITGLHAPDAAERARSLAVLAEVYWRPVCTYVRVRWRKDQAEAEDLTQAFFATALDRRTFERYDPARGRFRTFLRHCVDRHVVDGHRRDVALRRGGGDGALHLDAIDAPAAEAEAEAAFDAAWLRRLVTLACERLDAGLRAKGKPVHADLFQRFHGDDDPPSYGAVAEQLGVKVTDVTNWLAYARREFRRIALDLMREITASEDEFADEAMAAFGLDVRAPAAPSA